MIDYRGKYRVTYDVDKRTGKAAEFTFIPCGIKKNSNISRHSGNMLNAYIPSIKVFNRLLREYPELFTSFQVGDSEGTLLFKESDMKAAAVILKARTKGKDMPARPKRQVTLSEDRKKILSDRMKQIQANNKIIGEKTSKTG